MKKLHLPLSIGLLLFTFLFANAQNTAVSFDMVLETDFRIAFGSCNKHNVDNLLWDDIANTKPDVWIWGGDIIYADTDNMLKLRKMYAEQNNVIGYKKLKDSIPVIGTWDDHDYGLNDGGEEFKAKKESQQEFLNFLKVPKDSPRRSQEGVYAVHTYNTPKGILKVLVLDTRYFRTKLTKDTETKRRNKPNKYGEGTVLGSAQWQWLENELNTSTADFNILVSSIQVLSNEHGFETWGNFPHEVDKLKKVIADSNAKGVVVITGDRHISEFSKVNIEGANYPLIDFTSSGLTHTYSSYPGEPNPFRVGEEVFVISFGTLEFNFEQPQIVFKMIGDGGKVLGELVQQY